ncbi:MAG: 2-C-methyl-D-erythritol 4-phosphate cytidylyltransferase [Phycisphaerae bacterium]|nr:2-C-methyl-D-erythritol 4-phosphate cytidylyltransferase [Phycisphaerae bacterium]
MAKFGIIIVAAGASSRFGGDEKKQFEDLAGRAVFIRAAEPLMNHPEAGSVVVVVAPDDLERIKLRWGSHLGFHGIKLTGGGAQRVDSVAAGFALIPDDCDHVAIHDAARPLIGEELIEKVFAEAVASGAAIPAVPLTATLKRVEEGPPGEWGGQKRTVTGTPGREGLWLAQTPQVFRRTIYAEALAKRDQLTVPITDDAQLVEAIGHPVSVVRGTAENFKITTAEDLAMARDLLKARGVTGPKAPDRRHRF